MVPYSLPVEHAYNPTHCVHQYYPAGELEMPSSKKAMRTK
jgi:hypothetical protein